MTTKFTSWLFMAMAGTLGAALVGGAQDTPPPAQTAAPDKPAAKTEVKKTRKTWTDDDVASLRSPADIYVEQKEAQAAEAARLAKQADADKQAAAAKPKPEKPAGPPPALSNPNSGGDADKMIAWEDRDIASQQEFVDNLRTQIDEAPADQKEHLQQLLQERLKTLEETRKEREALQEKKKDLEKQPPAGDNAAPPQTPPQ